MLLLSSICLVEMLPSDSGPEPSKIFQIFLNVLSFPFLYLAVELFEHTLITVAISYLLNSLFYAFIIERIYFYFKKEYK